MSADRDELKQQLETSRSTATRWKSKAATEAKRRLELEQQIDKLETRVREIRQWGERQRRRSLQSQPLIDTLSAHIRTIEARTDPAERLGREQALLDVSPEYACAFL